MMPLKENATGATTLTSWLRPSGVWLRPTQTSTSGAKRGLPATLPCAHELAVPVQLDAARRVERRDQMVPGVERKLDVRLAFLPSPAHGELQPEPAFGIDPEEVAGLVVASPG